MLWAQWRATRSFYARSGFTWTIFIGLAWYGLWLIAALVARTIMADPAIDEISNALPGALLIVLLYWQLVPLLMAAAGASLELHKLQAYPIPFWHLFCVELLLRTTSGIEMCMVLAGVAVGVAQNPALPAWAGLGVIPFVILNLLIALGLRDVVVRLMTRRRIREIAAIVLVILAAVPQFALRRGSGFRVLRPFLEGGSWAGWPWTATANLLHARFVATSLVILAGWCALMAVFAAWQFRRMLAFDPQAARAGSGQGGTGGGLLDRVYRLPSAMFGDPLGAMIEKEIRYLVRSPRFRLVFLMGCTFGLIVARTFGTSAGAGSFLPDSLTGASIYALLLLGEVCFWNSFGFDRSAAQIYFLAPVPFNRVLIAKNIAALIFVALEILIAALLSALLRLPIEPRQIPDAFCVTGVVCLFLLSAGNIVSVRNARATNPQSSLRTSAAGRTQAFLFLLYPATFFPAAMAYFARWLFGSNVAFFAVLAVVAGVGLVFYKVALETATQSAEERREQMIAALSQGEGPIAG